MLLTCEVTHPWVGKGGAQVCGARVAGARWLVRLHPLAGVAGGALFWAASGVVLPQEGWKCARFQLTFPP